MFFFPGKRVQLLTFFFPEGFDDVPPATPGKGAAEV
jgi:hypothetical protein